MANWKVRFFTIWTGQVFSLLGSSLVGFALVWWLTESTNSPTILATAMLVTILPPIALGPIAGTFIDRWDRRNVMIGADGLVAVCTAVLAILFWLGIVQTWHIYVIMFLRALGGAFHQPAMMASTSLMVPHEQLTRVGRMNQTMRGIMRIISPILGALLLDVLPLQGILLIDIATAALAIGPLLFISVPRPQASSDQTHRPSFLREFIEGFSYVWSWKALFIVVGTCTLANVFLGPAWSYLPLLITREFGGSAIELSLVMSVQGIGLISGGFLMTLWRGFKRRLVTSALGWFGVGIAYMVAAVLPGSAFPVLLIAMFAMGFIASVGSAPLDAFYQTCVAPDKQGRVFAVLGSIDGLTMPFGLVLAGILGDSVPLRVWWILVGASHSILAVAWWFMPSIARAEVEQRNVVSEVQVMQPDTAPAP
jgi:MFS transporter, DHA3 family, macrolide efflux protein